VRFVSNDREKHSLQNCSEEIILTFIPSLLKILYWKNSIFPVAIFSSILTQSLPKWHDTTNLSPFSESPFKTASIHIKTFGKKFERNFCQGSQEGMVVP